MTTEEFIKKGIEVHGDEYTYDNTNFVGWNTKVTITCKIHGDFEISPRHFIYRKHGCNKCRRRHISESKMFTQEEFLKKAREVHGDKYDYQHSVYKGIDVEVEITCGKHGIFHQTPYNHINKKCGCSACRYDVLSEKYRLKIDDLHKRFKEKHGDKYGYPNLPNEYINNRSKITIICPIHGKFRQTAAKHLNGRGCPYCNESHLEKEIGLFFEENKIEFIRQKSFEWLKHEKPLYLDFYLPQYNVAVECQGEQHYELVERFGGEREFLTTVERDKTKNECCKLNGVKLLFYTKYKNVEGEDIYCNKDDLLQKILEYGNN